MTVRKQWIVRVAFLAAFTVLAAFSPLAAQETGADQQIIEEKQREGAINKSLLDYFNEGGLFMYPILLTSIFGLAITVYCGIQVRRERIMPRNLIQRINGLLAERKLREAFNLCREETNPLASVLGAALTKANFEMPMFNKASMESAATEAMYQEETKQGIWVNYLNVCAQIAPLLGLFGTVMGMIFAFDELAAGRAEPDDLAKGIGIAMLTTAGGLMVAIPTMAVYFYFRGSLTTIYTDMSKTVSNMLDLFTGEVDLTGDRAPTGYTQEVKTEDIAAAQAAAGQG